MQMSQFASPGNRTPQEAEKETQAIRQLLANNPLPHEDEMPMEHNPMMYAFGGYYGRKKEII